jgi:hypothetical protein
VNKELDIEQVDRRDGQKQAVPGELHCFRITIANPWASMHCTRYCSHHYHHHHEDTCSLHVHYIYGCSSMNVGRTYIRPSILPSARICTPVSQVYYRSYMYASSGREVTCFVLIEHALHSSELHSTVCLHLGPRALDLSGAKLVHACVVRVARKHVSTSKQARQVWSSLHVVLSRVESSAGARVTSHGAASGRRCLRRGIRDTVTETVATALEGVVQTSPMADLVGQSLSDCRNTQHGAWINVQDVNSRW